MRATRRLFLCVSPIALSAALAAVPPAPQTAAQPIAFGEKFPGGVFENINSGVGGPASINLGEVIGRKPVVFCVWSVGHQLTAESLR